MSASQRMSKHSFIVLVCGGRHYSDRRCVYRILDQIHEIERITLIVQGFATGADRLAHYWALDRGVASTGTKYQITPDMWREQGRAAGFIRNRAMWVEQRPHLCVAFPGGPGTASMCSIAGPENTITITKEGKVK